MIVLPPSRTPPYPHVAPGRTKDAAQIDAGMIVEAAILDRDHRLHEMRREIVGAASAALQHAARGENFTVGGLECHRAVAVGAGRR